MRRYLLADAALVLLLGGASIVVLLAAEGLPASRWEPLGPASVPRALAIGLIILAAAVMVQILWKSRQVSEEVDDQTVMRIPVRRYAETLALIVATVIAVGAMYLDWVGYSIATFVLTMVSVQVLSRFSRRTILPALVLASALSFGLSFVMTGLLSTPLP